MDAVLDIAYAQIADDAVAGVDRYKVTDTIDEAFGGTPEGTERPDPRTWGRTPEAQKQLSGLKGFMKS